MYNFIYTLKHLMKINRNSSGRSVQPIRFGYFKGSVSPTSLKKYWNARHSIYTLFEFFRHSEINISSFREYIAFASVQDLSSELSTAQIGQVRRKPWVDIGRHPRLFFTRKKIPNKAPADFKHRWTCVDSRPPKDVTGNDLPFGGETILGEDFRRVSPDAPRAIGTVVE